MYLSCNEDDFFGIKEDHDNAVGIVGNIIANYEPDLIELTMGIIFRNHNVKKGGKRILATISKPSELLEFFASYYFHDILDIIIEIDLYEWREMNALQQTALLHHELKHIVLRWDKKKDAIKRKSGTDRVDFYLTLHDVEEFDVIKELYGDWQGRGI